MSDIERKAILHVCRTGPKEQFYTLYIEGIVRFPNGNAHYSNFVKNLAHKEVDALKEAKRIQHEECAHFDETEIQIHDSPRPIYSHFTAFGDVEMRMAKSRKVWWGRASEKFWDLWKSDKAGIKEAGYWPKRNDDGSWLVFKRVAPMEIEWRDE